MGVSVMEPLATPADVQRLGVPVTDENQGLVDSLLDSVSAAVRDAAGTPITRVTVEVVREGTWDQNLLLPGAPIREIKSVTIDEQTVSDWVLRDKRLYRKQGWSNSTRTVRVVYDYGLDAPPADISKLVATLVAAGVNELADGGAGTRRGISSVRIDDAQVSYTRGDDEVLDLTELPDRVKASLKARFSGSAFVSRSL